jgi:hypothetical protein
MSERDLSGPCRPRWRPSGTVSRGRFQYIYESICPIHVAFSSYVPLPTSSMLVETTTPPLDVRRNDSPMDTNNVLETWDSNKKREHRQPLDLRVLGMRCVSGLDKLDITLVRYHQDTPDAPLCLEVLEVRANVAIDFLPLMTGPERRTSNFFLDQRPHPEPTT